MTSHISTVNIRTAIVEDIPTIQDIAKKTWPHTYSEIISKDQIKYMTHLMYNTDTLVKQWYNGCTFLVAEINKAPVGYASYRAIEVTVYKLDKLYVLPKHHKLSAGKKLLHEVIKKNLTLGGKELQLQVNSKNNAVTFYQKMGFDIILQDNFHFGEGYYMNDYIMSIKL